jgi:hypothetical protein
MKISRLPLVQVAGHHNYAKVLRASSTERTKYCRHTGQNVPVSSEGDENYKRCKSQSQNTLGFGASLETLRLFVPFPFEMYYMGLKTTYKLTHAKIITGL